MALFFCCLQEMYDQALPLMERVLTICEGTRGLNHPQTVDVRGSVLDMATQVMEQGGALHGQVGVEAWTSPANLGRTHT